MSRYTTVEKTWEERVRTLRQDFEDGDYARLYFLLSLCLVDAFDENDYDRHEAIRKAIEGMRNHDPKMIAEGIDELAEL